MVLGTNDGKLCVLDENKKTWACELSLVNKNKTPTDEIHVTSM